MSADPIVKSILDYLEDSINQKCYDFNQSMLKVDKTFKLRDPLLCRHFIFKAFEEVNQKLKKEKKDCRVVFDADTYYYLIDQTYEHFKECGCILNDIIVDLFAFRI